MIRTGAEIPELCARGCALVVPLEELVGERERDREKREEEDRRQAETDRRGRELKEAWRQHHPQKDKTPRKRGE
jgi:hypothetical protein